MRSNTLALSTGQAARYCFVTPETILNWIRTGRLPAQRTMGGQYRIRVKDLRKFLKDHGMSTDLLDEESGIVPFCWEFRDEGRVHGDNATWEDCEQCPVKLSRARACYQLRRILADSDVIAGQCMDCEYRNKYGVLEE